MPIQPDNCGPGERVSGFCLEDGTPILVVFDDGTQTGWINVTTGVFTSGSAPVGTKVCDQNVTIDLDVDCATDSITVCQGTDPWIVAGTVSISEPVTVDAVDFDIRNLLFATDKIDVSGSTVTIQEPITVDGPLTDTELRATPILVSGTVTVNEPVTVDGTVALDAPTLAALEATTANQGTSPWVVSGTVSVTEPVTVDSTDFDIRNLLFTTDKVDVSGSLVMIALDPDGTLDNGAETPVSAVAVQVLAANAVRKKTIVQNTGANNVRIGTTGVTATTGIRLSAGDVLVFSAPYCPTNAIFAVREGASDSIILAQEIT